MSHTPTPWNKQHKFLDTNTYLLTEVDYQRAKQCVNACEGMDSPKIDIGLLRVDNEQKKVLLASCEAALVERDKEIQALRDRVKDLEDAAIIASIETPTHSQLLKRHGRERDWRK